MQTLLVDIGNTRVKWRLVDLALGLAEGDPMGAELMNAPAALTAAWRGLSARSAYIANVADAASLARIREVLDATLAQPDTTVLVATGHEAGVTNVYRKPERLGPDRWAALIGARAAYPERNLVIASLGTATTIDLLRADGRFAGGVILPGMSLMRSALAQSTARLPVGEGRYAKLADNTNDAIASGIVHAQAGAIERVMRELQLRPQHSVDAPPEAGAALCLLTGGDAAALQGRLPFFALLHDNLVIRGLYEIARGALSTREPLS